MGSSHWPLLGLVVRTPRLELRYPDDTLLLQLAELAMQPIHPPDTMPFSVPWSDGSPEDRARSTLQFNWKNRAEWTADAWHCNFVTVVDGAVVGSQGVGGHSFARTRAVETGSWIGLAHQGQGIGKEMRAAVVHFAFAGLGAQRCESGAFDDNGRSLGVSRSLGYVDNGDLIHTRRDGAGRIVKLLLTREAWEPRRRDDITIEGLDGCLEMFGALSPSV
jgi:RimJ/RimL family protein N-acetyltransferase